MLTEIAVVLSLDFVGLAVAVALARWAFARGQGGAEARRLVNAAARASEAFLWRESKVALGGTAVAVVLVLATNGLLIARRAPGFTTTAMLWGVLGTLLGAGLTVGIAFIAAAVGLRATLRTVRAAQLSLDGAGALAMRASGVTALAADALSTGATAGLFGLVYLLGGGGAPGDFASRTALLERAAAVLPGLALGSVATALVVGVGGAAYHVSANLAGLAAESLDPNDPRNPALVATLVGEHVGLGAGRAVDMFAATTLATVVTVSVGVASFREHGVALGDHAWALITLPLIVRGVGVIASVFGLMTARATEAGGAAVDALFRGQLTASALVVGGLAGAAAWLLGAPTAGWFVGAGALGVGLGLLVGHAARLRVDRRRKSVQDVLEATRGGHVVTLARGLSLGAGAVWLPMLLLAGTLASAFHLGERSHLPGGGVLGTATALAGLLATSAYMLAVGLFGPVASGALTIALLEPESMRPEVRRRTALLDDAGFEGGAVAQAFFIVLGCGAALVAGLSLAGGSAGRQPGAFSLSRPEIVGSGILGCALALTGSQRALEIAAAAARGALLEIERQLRGFPRDGGVLVLPAGYTPSYRALIDLAGKLSTEGLWFPVCLALLGPAALGFALSVLYTTPGLAKDGLTCFVVVASATGLGAALSADGSRVVLGAAYRSSRPRGASSGFEAALAGHGLGSFLGGAAAPATQLFVKAAAAVALLVSPFLSVF